MRYRRVSIGVVETQPTVEPTEHVTGLPVKRDGVTSGAGEVVTVTYYVLKQLEDASVA